MARQNPLEARDLLEIQQVNLTAELHRIAAENAELEQQLADASRSAADSLVKAAAAGEHSTAADPGRDRIEMQIRLEQNQRAAAVITAALREIPRQLAALTRSSWDAFAAEAARLDTQAVDALADLEVAYRSAHDRWLTAQSAWETAIRDLHDAMEPSERIGGQGLGGERPTRVPPWPLEHPDLVFGQGHRPRPPGWAPQDQRRALEQADVVEDLHSGGTESGQSARARSGDKLIDRYGFSRYAPIREEVKDA